MIQVRSGIAAFIIGIIALLQLPALLTLWSLVLMPVILRSIFLLSKSPATHVYKQTWFFFCFMVLGFLWALFRADNILSSRFNEMVFKNDSRFIITGRVISLPEALGPSIRFKFQVDSMETDDGISVDNIGKARLTWYAKDIILIPGDRWRLNVKLKKPYGFKNPGGFDYEGWLFQHRIHTLGYVVNGSKNELLERPSDNSLISGIISSPDYPRYLLRNLVNQTSIANAEKSLLLALSLGDRSQLSVTQWKTLKQTGTSHLLAISGLHIGLAAGIFFILGRWLWVLFTPLPRYLASQRIAVFVGLSGALLYATLAGFSVPTQRALIMLTVCLVAIFFYKKFAVSHIIAVSLWVMLLIDPFAVMNIGFWLSFIAVSMIAYGIACRVQADSSWWRWGQAQYLVAVGLLPVIVLYFQQYPLLGFIANVVAVPYVSLVVMPLTLAGVIGLSMFFPLGEFLLKCSGYALSLLWSLLDYLSTMKFALWDISISSPLVFILGMVGVIIILLPRGLPARWLGIFWLFPFFFPYQQLPGHGEFWLTQLDVGQGSAAVIQTNNHTLIYDTGDRFSERFNAGEMVLIPFLKHQHIYKPDVLIVSHRDRDHIGGVKAVLAQYPDIKVLGNVTDSIRHANLERCFQGKHWHWDGVDFEILSPTLLMAKRPDIRQENNNSCVLKVSNGEHSVLFPGDIQKPTESLLVSTIPNKLSSTVLIVPHHGSRTSSSLPFIKAVSPEVAVFPVGYRNRFGFPKQDIISRYKAGQVKILNTARDGALLFQFENGFMKINRYRKQNWRFWMSSY